MQSCLNTQICCPLSKTPPAFESLRSQLLTPSEGEFSFQTSKTGRPGSWQDQPEYWSQGLQALCPPPPPLLNEGPKIFVQNAFRFKGPRGGLRVHWPETFERSELPWHTKMGPGRRAGHLGFAVLQCSSKSYFQDNPAIKKITCLFLGQVY